MGRRKPRQIGGPKVYLDGRDREGRAIDEDFELADLDAITHCTLLRQPITRLPELGANLVELELLRCEALHSLEGIERCTGLARLKLGMLGARFDLAAACERLAELPELTTLSLYAIPATPALAMLPSLIELDAMLVGAADREARSELGPPSDALGAMPTGSDALGAMPPGSDTLGAMPPGSRDARPPGGEARGVMRDFDLAAIGAIPTLRRLVLRGARWTLPPVEPLAGTITSLTLHDVAAMPASIGSLVKLERLRIERSRHLRKLSSGFGKLAALVEVTIDAPIRSIDPAISKCAQLEILSLSRTSLATIPDDIGALAKLRELHLAGTSIAKVPESVDRLLELRTITVPHRVEIPAVTATRIANRPVDTPHVEFLRLGENDRLPDDFGDPIRLELAVRADHGPVPQLAKLRRCTNAILTVPDVAHAIASLAGCPHLDQLTLKQLVALPPSIASLHGLKALTLSGALETLPPLPQLEVLYLHCPVRALPPLPALRRLHLDVSGPLPALPPTITELHLNILDGGSVGAVELPALRSLHVWGPARELAALLASVPSIETLEIGRGTSKLPAEIGGLAKLARLELHRAKLRELPYELRHCASLVYVNLPCPAFDESAISSLPPIKWTKRKWADQVRFEKSKR